MHPLKSRSFWLTSLVLFLTGLAVGIWQGISRGSAVGAFLSDLFFSEFMVFFLFGGYRMLGNMHAFTTASFSFRFVHKLFRNQKVSGTKSRDEYLNYRESRKEHPEAVFYLAAAGFFLILSLAIVPLSGT